MDEDPMVAWRLLQRQIHAEVERKRRHLRRLERLLYLLVATAVGIWCVMRFVV